MAIRTGRVSRDPIRMFRDVMVFGMTFEWHVKLRASRGCRGVRVALLLALSGVLNDEIDDWRAGTSCKRARAVPVGKPITDKEIPSASAPWLTLSMSGTMLLPRYHFGRCRRTFYSVKSARTRISSGEDTPREFQSFGPRSLSYFMPLTE